MSFLVILEAVCSEESRLRLRTTVGKCVVLVVELDVVELDVIDHVGIGAGVVGGGVGSDVGPKIRSSVPKSDLQFLKVTS